MVYFSKALFKQSIKANWIKWVAVTLATCVMLAIVIIVLGSININGIRDSLKGVFEQANQESYLKENAIDSYSAYLTTTELENTLYTKELNEEEQGTLKTIWGVLTSGYDTKISEYQNSHEGQKPTGEELTKIRTESVNEVVALMSSMSSFYPEIGEMLEQVDEKTLVMAIDSFLVAYEEGNGVSIDKENGATLLNDIRPILESTYLKIVYNVAYDTYMQQENATEALAVDSATQAQNLTKDAMDTYKSDALQDGVLNPDYVYNADNYKNRASEKVNAMIYDQAYKMTYATSTADSDEEKDAEAKQYAVTAKIISNTAISTYELCLAEGQTKEDALKLATQSVTDQIDEEVAVALEELGNMDIYGLIIGSIFYRIAGLLLPMVFVIMVANGLLAGQVDSGSMAYVLSTPTRRRTVTVTQMLYLMMALFTMFALVTAVSVVSIWIVGGNSFAINFAEILLFNLGAFLTMFAFAGFCFMCSAIFNRTKHSLSIGGGISMFMLVCTILGLFGSNVVPSAMRIDQMNFFNYLSIITLFDTTTILSGGISFIWNFLILFGIGLITFIIGVFCFDKKDLPL